MSYGLSHAIHPVSYLVGLVGGGGSDLTLLTRSKLGQVTVVVTLPVDGCHY
jgi:hypothetical protein